MTKINFHSTSIPMNYFKSLLKEKEIKGLDGLRAMSCLMVICAHLVDVNHAAMAPFLATALDLGKEGVALFFAISGFIITLLLFKEKTSKAGIDLNSFYIRRTIRILPVLFVYLFFILILKMNNVVEVDNSTLRSNFFLYTNYSLAPYSKYLGHIWSIAVEEHFYLFWPLLVLLLNRKNLRYAILLIIVASPFIRVLSYYLMPEMASKLDIMTHCRLDGFMFGALIADLYDNKKLEAFYKKIKNPDLVFAGLLLFYALIHPYLKTHSFKGYWILIGSSLNSLNCALIIFMAICDRKSMFYNIFNSKILRHIGIISYSLYIWQEFCVYYFANPFTALACSYALAILSFMLIETTSNNVKKRFQQVHLQRA